MKTQHTPTPPPTPPGTTEPTHSIWYLEQGGALTYRAGGEERLVVTYGRVWATQTGCGNDLVLQAYDVLNLRAGQIVVLEGWPCAGVDVQTNNRPARKSSLWLDRLRSLKARFTRISQPQHPCIELANY
jgi:hypothetical protein